MIYEKKDDLIGLKEKFEEDINNIDFNFNELNIKNDINNGNDFNKEYFQEYDENVPLKKNFKKFGKMKDI